MRTSATALLAAAVIAPVLALAGPAQTASADVPDVVKPGAAPTLDTAPNARSAIKRCTTRTPAIAANLPLTGDLVAETFAQWRGVRVLAPYGIAWSRLHNTRLASLTVVHRAADGRVVNRRVQTVPASGAFLLAGDPHPGDTVTATWRWTVRTKITGRTIATPTCSATVRTPMAYGRMV